MRLDLGCFDLDLCICFVVVFLFLGLSLGSYHLPRAVVAFLILLDELLITAFFKVLVIRL